MDFGQAFDNAGTLFTLIGLLAVIPILFVMTRNMGNSEFDMTSAFTAAIFGLVEALMPALFATVFLAVILYLIANGDW